MAPKTLRILCFGNSLTAGYCSMGMNYHPYSLKLKELLNEALPGTNVDIEINGLPGDVAAFPRFRERLERECEKRWYDWVIILGGTNDIGTGVSIDQTFPALQATYAIPLSRNSKVLALTVPECSAKSARIDQKRNDLNSRILNYRQPNLYHFDLYQYIPYHSLSKEDRQKFWDDGLHLTPEGYDWMGEHIAREMISLIRYEDQMELAKSKIQPRSKTEDALDEEEGNPSKLSEGYVVVRKRDLD